MCRVCLAFVAVLLLFGCSSGDNSTGVEPENFAPTISFATDKIAVKRGATNELIVVVNDRNDDDKLTVTWDITSGTLTPVTSPSPSQHIMAWDTPPTVGTDTVVVAVSDGEASASVEAEIKRATLTVETTARTLFSKTNSPYILAPDNAPPSILVSGGATTTIEPGVEIYLDYEKTTIDVVGTLVANGTDAEPVVITANSRTVGCGDNSGWWEGIQARSEDQYIGAVNLNHTEVSHAVHNIRLIGAGTANLRNCKILCGGRAGVRITGTGTLVVRNCEVLQSQQYGVEIFGVTSLPASVTVTGCVISFNQEYGIRLDLQDYSRTVPIDISYNLIKYNEGSGITLYNRVYPEIHFNEIWYNNLFNETNVLFIPITPPPAMVDTLYITNNYWNYDDEGLIQGTIRDNADDSRIRTRAVVNPWLDTSPLP